MANWLIETGVWLPIDSLATSYKGPVVLTDETQTIQWFCEKQSRAAVDHKEHKRDERGFVYDGDEPVIETRKVKPAYWALAKVID